MSPSEADGRGAGRIEAAFEKIRSDGRVGLMTHIVAGYPDLDTSRALIERMVELGVDIIEIQIPFSDPTADGPTITKACQDALDGGVRVADAFAFMSEVTEEYPATPFLFMSYFNIAFAYRDATAGGHGVEDGVAGFVGASKACGASGLILPDVPPDMTREGYPEACREHGLHPIYVVSPNIGDDRIEAISRESAGFVYATSRTGPTGKAVNPDITPLESFLARGVHIHLSLRPKRRRQ